MSRSEPAARNHDSPAVSSTPELESIWPEAAAAAPQRTGSLGRRMVLATLVFGLIFTMVAVAVRTWSAW